MKTCAECGKSGSVATDQTDPGSDEMAIDSRGLVKRNEYVCGECLDAAQDDSGAISSTTTAADLFCDLIAKSWDSRGPWDMTAQRGLSDVDADALRKLCGGANEDYDAAEARVMNFVRRKLSRN